MADLITIPVNIVSPSAAQPDIIPEEPPRTVIEAITDFCKTIRTSKNLAAETDLFLRQLIEQLRTEIPRTDEGEYEDLTEALEEIEDHLQLQPGESDVPSERARAIRDALFGKLSASDIEVIVTCRILERPDAELRKKIGALAEGLKESSSDGVQNLQALEARVIYA